MTIGPHTLELASALVAEKRLEAEIPRRWRIAPASGISTLSTPEKATGDLGGRHHPHWPHRRPHRIAVSHR